MKMVCGYLGKILNEIAAYVAVLIWALFFLIAGFEHNLSCGLGSSEGKSVFILKSPDSLTSVPLGLAEFSPQPLAHLRFPNP